MECSVEADPDIAGLGVRIALYVEAFLCVLPSVLFVPFGPKPWETCAVAVEDMYKQGRTTVMTLLVTNGALLIVSVVKAATGDLTRYHAAIVLHLSWIVFLSALSSAITLSFSHPRGNPLYMFWLRATLIPFRSASTIDTQELADRLFAALYDFDVHHIPWPDLVHSEHHIISLSVHMFCIGGLGVVLFGNMDGFGYGTACNRDVVLWSFNVHVGLSGPAFQHFWFAVYVVAFIPVINAVLCAAVVIFVTAAPWWAGRYIACRLSPKCKEQQGTLMHIGLVLPFLFWISMLIASTEKTIRANRASNNVGSGEEKWGFGQILAIVLLVPSAYEAYKRFRAFKTRCYSPESNV